MSDLAEMFRNLKIISMTNADWQSKIESVIGPIVHGTSVPLERIYSFVVEARCTTIIVEKEYVDQDFLDEFSSFYYNSFAEYKYKCIRLHFFQAEIDYADIEDLSDKANTYIGFSVIRPIQSFRTGRTILKPSFEDSNSHYILCKDRFEVNLSGNPLRVKGMPFVQQDTNVSVCAEACLWMMGLYMHQRYKCPRHPPSKITDFATQYYTLGPAREGFRQRL